MLQSIVILFWSLFSPDILELRVEGIEENKGVIRIAFYDSEAIHLDEEEVTYYHEEQVTNSGTMDIQIDIPSGDYSVAIYHDLNADKQLNKNMFGIPKEPYGFSNNVIGMFGPPSFEEAKIEFPKTNRIIINLR